MDKMSLSEYIKGFEDEIEKLNKRLERERELNEKLISLIGKEMRKTDTEVFELPEKMIFKMDDPERCGDLNPSLNGFTESTCPTHHS